MIGWVYMNDSKFPLTFNPNTGTIEANGTYYFGEGKILFMHLVYNRISDTTSYGYTVSNSSYLSVINTRDNTSETKYGEDIINHSMYKGSWYVSYLVQINVGSIIPFGI